jgi:nucleotide-binding universal stress UspA family protein
MKMNESGLTAKASDEPSEKVRCVEPSAETAPRMMRRLRRGGRWTRIRLMYKAIVVGTDGSETAGIAVQRAVALASLTGATLHIVNAYQPLSLSTLAVAATAGGMANVDVESINKGVTAESERVCEHAANEARRVGVTVETHAVPVDAADALVGVAQEVDADLVVIGNRGMSGKRRFVLGSVPNKVSHHCPCSLLIVDTTRD